MPRKMAVFRADTMGSAGPKRLSTRNYGYCRTVIEKRRTTPTQNFLEVLTEASALQRIEMALKLQNDREMKGLEGSNPPFSASESSVFGVLFLSA
jgi:hypothetical protein